MAEFTASLDLKGFARYAEAIKKRNFQKALEKHVGAATERNAMMLAARCRKTIAQGVDPKNAPLTMLIKGSTKPLVGRNAQMFQSLTYKVLSWDRAFVGALRTDANFNVVRAVHEGAVIPVTEKMRAMFFYLWLASLTYQGKRTGPMPTLTGRAAELWELNKIWYPLKATTRVIRIPPRPFIKTAMDDQKLQRGMEAQWRRGVREAIEEVLRTARKVPERDEMGRFKKGK